MQTQDANMANSCIEECEKIVGKEHVLRDPNDCEIYASDWTKTAGKALCVLLPKTTEEVANILKTCQAHAIAVVPSGGRTGLAAGAVASRNELVMSMSRMNRIDPIDPDGLMLRVQAGATTQAVHEHCAQQGLFWPIDLASKGTSQIGGNLATNAGGVRVIGYGMARKWVTGLQIVTMGGEVIELNRGLEKNNTGLDLIQLMIGSEGILAVITEATLKLTQLPHNVRVMLFPAMHLEELLRLLLDARKQVFKILAFEFFSHKCLRAVEQHLNIKSPFATAAQFYGLIEIEEFGASCDRWLEHLYNEQIVTDAAIAHSSQDQHSLWKLREGITESLQDRAPLKKYDVSVPVKHVPTFLKAAQNLVSKFRIELFLFGHLGDGSPHLNLLKPPDVLLEEFLQDCEEFEAEFFWLLKTYSGSVSAEHGVGLLKKHWLTFSRTPEELRIFRGIKKTFDPKGLLNPGKVIDIE